MFYFWKSEQFLILSGSFYEGEFKFNKRHGLGWTHSKHRDVRGTWNYKTSQPIGICKVKYHTGIECVCEYPSLVGGYVQQG